MTIPPLSAASPLSNTLTGLLLGIITVVGFHACLYMGAYWFFAKHLYRDYEIKRLSVQNLFAATFTVCVSMLQLLLLELLHILNPTLRKLVWNVDLICVLLLLYLILPVFIVYNLLVPDQDLFKIPDLVSAFPSLQSLNIPAFSIGHLSLPASLPLPASLTFPSPLTERSRGKLAALLPRYPIPWRRWFLVAFGCVILLPLLWSCFYQSGRFLHLDPAILSSLSYTECLLAYVGVCGVTVVSALAGFGSVNYPYRNITAFLSPVSQEQVAEVEQRLLQTLSLIAEKKKKRKQLQQSLTRPGRSSHWPTPTTGLHPAGPPGSCRGAAGVREGVQASRGRVETEEGVSVFVHGGSASSDASYRHASSGSDAERGGAAHPGTEQYPFGGCAHAGRGCTIGGSSTVSGVGAHCAAPSVEEPDFASAACAVQQTPKLRQGSPPVRERPGLPLVYSEVKTHRQSSRNRCPWERSEDTGPQRLKVKEGPVRPGDCRGAGLASTGSFHPESDSENGTSFGMWACLRAVWARVRWLCERIVAAVKGRAAEKECQQLQSEIAALEDLSRELFVGLDDLVQSRAQAIFSRTLLGRLKNLLGWCMTVVCVYRIITAATNVLLGRVNTTDPATRTLEVALYYLNIPLNVAVVSPYLSLLLLGWIIALTIRGFIEKLLAVFRYVSTSVSSNVFALVMSEIMGFYFSACVLLTRMYLPQSYRDAVTEVIAPSLDFRVFHLHFDRVFLLSSLTSFGIVMLSHKHSLEKFKNL
ncbi:putative G protein-coupled receptor 89 isoform 5 [Besnoitia besnoiti]|uniref:Putative G protein-coupled receptor 89 isoform 5 n=1 Tax=Besnoitia besnoiti TaxID=94643 RepID=A0A2A9MBX7_BESBE|nr:putative G protein-coupled receptor 89 isoform 5 [Besnoitia besnoiti]PFH34724.1 putative G protein-coupled receptor 89 isoform 5 [Besnoitia besnoiti]